MIELSVAEFLVLAALVATDPELTESFACIRGSYNETLLAYSMHHAVVLADIAIRNGASSRPDAPILVRMLGPRGGGESHVVPVRVDPAAWTAQAAPAQSVVVARPGAAKAKDTA
jgi:hypothetical protein